MGSTWSVLRGKREGKPQYVRLNISAKELLGHPDYKFLLAVEIPINSPDSEGLPNAIELETLNQLEDVLVERLETEQQSLCVLVSTMHGLRALIFYTLDRDFAQATI